MDYKERIMMLMEEKRIPSVRQLAVEINVPVTTLSKQMSGERTISLETIGSILNTFGDVSAEWLMRGDGAMLRSEIKPTTPEYQVPFLERLTTKLCEESMEYVEAICNITTSYYSIRKKNKEK